MRSRGRAVRALLAVGAVLVLLSAGCTTTTGDDNGVASAGSRIRDAIRNAIEEAKERQAQRTGEAQPRRPQDRSVLNDDERVSFDYAAYSRTVGIVLESLETYWRDALPTAFGVRFEPLRDYVYYRSDEGSGPACGGEPAPPRNAFYCPAGDFIAWDETGLLIPYYMSAGDFAAAYVLAHEFGHAIQFRARIPARLGIDRELQADCLAGTWARYAQEAGMLEPGDLDEALVAVFNGRDVPGTDWTNPQAHGSGFQRNLAFGNGYQDGPKTCAGVRATEGGVDTAV